MTVPFKFYHASFYGSRDHWRALERAQVKRILLNFGDIKRFDWDFIAGYREAGIEICLDSGAFSIWTGSVSHISLAEYISFVQEVGQHCFDPIFSLDQIAGRPGYRYRTRDEIEQAGELSYQNHQAMKQAGLRTLATFHGQEPPRFLHRLIKDGESYVACSPYKKHKKDRQARWLDNVFYRTVKGRARLHGLGIGDTATLTRFPFFSADSTTWAQTGIKSGSIIVPVHEKSGKPDFSIEPHSICVSDGNANVADRWPCSIEHALAWLNFCGTDLDGVQNSSTERMVVNAVFYRELETFINARRRLEVTT